MFSITIKRNDIPQVVNSVTDKAIKNVRDNAHASREYASAIAPVRTGALRASFYVNGPQGESDYIERVAAALRLNPGAGIVPELQAATPGVGGLRNMFGQYSRPEAVVSSCVEYSIYLEEGTVHIAPRPTFMQSALAIEQPFIAAMKTVANGPF